MNPIAATNALHLLTTVRRTDLETFVIELNKLPDFELASLAIVLSELNKKVNQLELERARKGLTR